MAARKHPEPDAPLPDPDDVLRIMLNTPHRPHVPKPKRKPAKLGKKPAK